MEYGDILLLEAQEYNPADNSGLWPVEIADATFDAIRLATALGIVVVEAAANGGNNLDDYKNPAGLPIFNRSSKDFRESGAIVVGAASSSSSEPITRLPFSNYGSRIDLYSFGENVETSTTDSTGTVNNIYTNTFNGTSSASAIISGAALIIQGISQARFGKPSPQLALVPYSCASIFSTMAPQLPTLKAISLAFSPTLARLFVKFSQTFLRLSPTRDRSATILNFRLIQIA